MGNQLIIDTFIVLASIVVALYMSTLDISGFLLSLPPEYELLSIFITGLCFVSVFTIAPATIVFGQMAMETSFVPLIAIGASGALLMDLIIFSFFRKRISKDAKTLCSLSSGRKIAWLCRLKISRWMLAVIGGLIIASPFPDEIGLAMMGVGSVKTRMLIPISYAMNALGILIVGLVARSL